MRESVFRQIHAVVNALDVIAWTKGKMQKRGSYLSNVVILLEGLNVIFEPTFREAQHFNESSTPLKQVRDLIHFNVFKPFSVRKELLEAIDPIESLFVNIQARWLSFEPIGNMPSDVRTQILSCAIWMLVELLIRREATNPEQEPINFVIVRAIGKCRMTFALLGVYFLDYPICWDQLLNIKRAE